MAKVLCCLVFSLFIVTEVYSSEGYYWRDFVDGIIPKDAIPAGNNSKGFSYIGQAYIHQYGLMLGTLTPGVEVVTVPCYGVKKTNVIIKILCSEEPNNFEWIKTNVTTYKTDIADKFPIVGGYDQKARDASNTIGLGELHIGRIYQQGEVIVGNIAAYQRQYTWFYYPFLDREIVGPEFEALVYTKKAVKGK